MAALVAGEKARMFALGGIARGGATRGGYHSGKVFVAIGGVQYATARPVDAQKVEADSLTINDTLNQTPNTCAMTVRGFVPTVGQSIVITLGTINTLVREFGGIVLSKDDGYVGSPANGYSTIRGIDVSWLALQRKVSGRYATVSASTIAAALVPVGFTGKNIQAGLPAIDTFSYTNLDVNAALTALAKRIGASWYWDASADLHFFTTTDTTYFTDPTPLTATHPTLTGFAATTDLSQIVTRCFVEGGGVTCLAAIGPGETSLPIEDAAWYPIGGGLVACPNQRLTYTAAIPSGGGGSLVGPGAAPSSAPALARAAGAGLSSGVYQYAYTDVTPSGESLPSPLASVTVGPVSGAPSVAPVVFNSATGGGQGPGWYNYAFTWVIAGVETPPSPRVAIQEPIGGDQLQITTIAVGPAGTTARNLYRTAAQLSSAAATAAALQFDVAVPGNVVTDVWDTHADSLLLGPAPSAGGNQVVLSGVAIGGGATTSRKIYRTAVNAAQLKLLTTLANNTATTYTDTIADGSLGANAPTSDTSALTQPTGQVNAGSTSLLLAGAGAFNTGGGWVELAGGQTVRYTGITGNTLTGIPASGSGSIVATVSYNATAVACAYLSGIPASGVGSIQYPILVGDPVNILAQVDDAPAQATLSALLDPTNLYAGARGIQEDYLTDGRIGYTEAHARGLAQIALRKDIDVSIRYQVQDGNTRAGRTIVVNLPLQGIVQSFKISQVTQSGFTPALYPIYTVSAGARFSFEDLLRGFGG